MPREQRLYRDPIIRILEKIRKKWARLNYPQFCIQAQRELNPEKSPDPNKNYSIRESIRAFAGPLYIDEHGRISGYVIDVYNRMRNRWNEHPDNHWRQLYRRRFEVQIFRRPTRTDPSNTETVIHSYLRSPRGNPDVADIDEHFGNVEDGIVQTRRRVADCRNVRHVDRAIEEQLRENDRIQNGA